MKNKHLSKQCDWFLVAVVVAEMVLIASSWPLWSSSSEFPVVPLIDGLASVPTTIDRYLTAAFLCALSFLLGGLLFIRAPAGATTRASAVALLLATLLGLLNQHRLQPWHWLTMLILAQRVFVSQGDRRRVNQLTIASIYVFAGISRLGPDTATGVSRQIIQLLVETLGANNVARDESVVFTMCTLMTLAETLTGILLVLRRTQHVGVICAVVLHVVLFSVLGPWGLQHHSGVLIWNAFFACAVPLLFRSGRPEVAQPVKSQPQQQPPPPLAPTAVAFVMGVYAIAAAALFGVADHWLGWQVYSPRTDVVRLYVRSSAIDKLPASLRPHVGDPQPLQDWCPVRPDRWSLEVLHAPLYPEDRFQLAVASAVCAELAENEVRVSVQRACQPWWWKGSVRTDLTGLSQLRAIAASFRLNGSVMRR